MILTQKPVFFSLQGEKTPIDIIGLKDSGLSLGSLLP